MLRSVRLRKGIVSLLAVALLAVFATGNAFAASEDEKLAELAQRVDGLESLVKDLSISVMNASKSLEAQATGLQPRIFNVENMVKDLSFDVKKTVAALSDMQGNVDALMAQVEEFQPLVINLQSTVVKFGDKQAYFESQLDKLTVGLANLSAHVDQTDANLEGLGGQIADLSDEFDELYSAASAIKATVDDHSAQLAELQEAAVALNVKVETNTQGVYENHEAIEELSSQVNDLSGATSQGFDEVGMAVGTLDERTSKLEQAVDELNILGPTLASLRNTVAGLAARADRVDARLGRLEDMAEGFAGTSEAFNQVASMTQTLAARLSDAEQMIAELKGGGDNASVAAAIEDLQEQIDHIKANLSNGGASSQAVNDLKSKIAQLVIELEATKMDLGALRDEMASNQVTSIDKQQIISEIRTEIRSEITDLSGAADLAREAAKKADAANGLALLALLAGVASIALNLLL